MLRKNLGDYRHLWQVSWQHYRQTYRSLITPNNRKGRKQKTTRFPPILYPSGDFVKHWYVSCHGQLRFQMDCSIDVFLIQASTLTQLPDQASTIFIRTPWRVEGFPSEQSLEFGIRKSWLWNLQDGKSSSFFSKKSHTHLGYRVTPDQKWR